MFLLTGECGYKSAILLNLVVKYFVFFRLTKKQQTTEKLIFQGSIDIVNWFILTYIFVVGINLPVLVSMLQ